MEQLNALKLMLFSLLLVIKSYDCQVVLTRDLLKQWLMVTVEQLFQKSIFKGLTNSLNISFNMISTIDPQTFNDLTNLNYFALYGNQLVTIDPQTFNSLTNLNFLGLFGNQIRTIDPQTFNDLKILKYLDLSYNPIR